MTDHAHCAHTSIAFPVSSKKVFTDLASFLVPIRALLLGLFLFSLNNVAIWSAWLRPPSGYRPFWMHRASDAAQYLTWARAFRSQVLIPDYHAPWPTTPGLFNPLFWFIGKSTAWFGFSLPAAFLIFHLALHIVAAYAFFFALEVFTTTATQKIWSFLVVICSVPLGSLTFLPRALLSHSKPMPVAGMIDFVWWSSDGFFLSNVKGSISAPPLSSGQWRVSHHMQTLALSPAWPDTKNT